MGRGARPSEAIRRGMKEGTILLNTKFAIALTSATTAVTAAALTATLGLAAASWVVAVRQMNWQMNGTNMCVATPLGSFAFFMALWVAMMAAMMLPGAAPAVLRSAHARGVRTVPLFVGSYLAVWTLVGVAVYALYRPHGSFAAGALVIAAGAYELTPLKQHFRRRCGGGGGPGIEVGLWCGGSRVGTIVVVVGRGGIKVHLMGGGGAVVLRPQVLPPKDTLPSASGRG